MARRQRKDNNIIIISGPQSDVNTADTTTDPLVQEVITTSIDTIVEEEVPNSQQGQDDGVLQTTAGLKFNTISVPTEIYAEGCRAVAAFGDPAVITAQDHMMSALFQHGPTIFERTKATGSPTTTAVIESGDDKHKPAGGYATTQIGLSLINRAASSPALNMWFPHTYTAATNTMNGLMALAAAPAADDIIYAGTNFQYAEQWDGLAKAYTLQIIGNDALQTAYIYGAVPSLSIPNTAPGVSPQFNFTWKAANGEYDQTISRPAAAYQKPLILAGSDCKIGLHGATAAVELCADIEITIGANWVADTCRTKATGIQAWRRGQDNITVTITLPHYLTPAELFSGGTAVSWKAAKRTGVDALLHLLVSWGQQVPGSASAAYFPALRLAAVAGGERDEGDAAVLTLKPAKEYMGPSPTVGTVPAVVFGRA